MKLKNLLLLSFAAVATFATTNIYAWKHAIYLGYGWGNEIEKNYRNSAVVLNAKLYKFPKIDNTLIATIDSSISRLHANTAENRDVTAASIRLSLRGYFINPDLHKVRPYIGISSGPAYLSNRRLGTQDQGGHFDLHSTLEGGMEFGLKKERSIDVNLHLAHYCNAGLASPNQGFNIPLVLSVGYQF